MSTPHDTPRTLMQAIRHFSDPDVCIAFVASLRWPDGPTCPRCGGKSHLFLQTRKLWKCRGCKRQFSVKVGTIFEDSPLGLDKWLCAFWMVANCKNGVSSYEVHRALGVTQKSAWFMLHRIRLAMRTGTFAKMSGEVEADETFVGGKARNMHQGKRGEKIKARGPSGKVVVMGILERRGEVRAKVVRDTRKATLQPEVRANVAEGATVYTDALKSYEGLDDAYTHLMIDHAISYAEGRVHTNGMENFWSLLKRGLNGTYISVQGQHLERYVDEQAFRFNHRKSSDAGRLVKALGNVAGRRLTYREVTGKAAR
jgi:transposase-like protein